MLTRTVLERADLVIDDVVRGLGEFQLGSGTVFAGGEDGAGDAQQIPGQPARQHVAQCGEGRRAAR